MSYTHKITNLYGFVPLLDRRSRNWNKILLSLILCLGIGLRLWQLGRDSFWNDEAGVALAALSPNIGETIQLARSHAMAMPLDYVITWLVMQVSYNEYLLRLPATIFSILTIIVSYQLFRYITNRKIALIAALLLAVSPLQIHYAQELRFYSAMIFFFQFSTLLLLRALEKNQKKNWIYYCVFTTIGTYFHVYVLLVCINGFIWYGINFENGLHHRRKLIPLLLSTIILIAIFLPGYLYFGQKQQFGFQLLEWAPSLTSEIFQGLGWKELPYTIVPGIGKFWYSLCFVFASIGIVYGLRKFTRNTLWLILVVCCQIVAIILADSIKHYWFAYRQLLQLQPYTSLFTAIGLWALIRFIFGSPHFVQRKGILTIRFVSIVIIGFTLSFLNIMALNDYYSWEKSIAREISQNIINNWQTQNKVFVYPGYQAKVFTYYFRTIYPREDILQSIHTIDNQNKFEATKSTGSFICYINTSSGKEAEDIALIQGLGFKTTILSEPDSWLGQSLNQYSDH